MAEPDFSLGSSPTFIAEELPAVLSRDSVRISSFSTRISIGNGAQETRSGLWAAPLARIDLGPAVRNLYTLRLLDSFHRRVYGPRDAFLFHNRLWDTTGQVPGLKTLAPAPITMLDEIIGTGDDVETDFQLVRNYGSAQQNIFKIKGTPLIAIDGVFQDPALSPPPYTISSTGLVQFATPPGSGLSITAGFDHYIVVRFEDDDLDMNLQNYRRGVATVRLREVRDFG